MITNSDPAHIALAQRIFDRQFAEDPELNREMDDRRKQLMFQDILYNFSFLSTAVKLEDEKIFSSYALWLYELLCNLMKDLDRDRIKDQMISHYTILKNSTAELFSGDQRACADRTIEAAIQVTEQAVGNYPISDAFLSGKHLEFRKKYLSALMRSETAKAIGVIKQAEQEGIPLEEIFEEIIMPAMHEVGELWHKNLITVDKEHYCTSTTQMVLSQFYPTIFSTPKRNRTVVTCCVGSELHEMGGRMVSDLFEYHGWDSIYLGAAVPVPSLIHAIQEYKPHLVALSVTMPQYLGVCRDAVFAIHDAFPSIRIAVGGRAFSTSNEIYKRWPVQYAALASELIDWAEDVVPVL